MKGGKVTIHFFAPGQLYPENYSLSIQKVKLRKDSDATRIQKPTEKKKLPSWSSRQRKDIKNCSEKDHQL